MHESPPESHFRAVEFAQLGVVEEDAVHLLVHLFQSDLFVAQHFAHENPALMPTDVSAIVHSPCLE